MLKSSANRPGLKAQGFVIDGKGELSMWSIGQFGDDNKSTRSLLHFTEEEKQRLAGRLPKKNKSKVTVAKTDKVDAEIQRLKNKKLKLEQQLSTATNPNADLPQTTHRLFYRCRHNDLT